MVAECLFAILVPYQPNRAMTTSIPRMWFALYSCLSLAACVLDVPSHHLCIAWWHAIFKSIAAKLAGNCANASAKQGRAEGSFTKHKNPMQQEIAFVDTQQ
jgi:hypothetical protein